MMNLYKLLLPILQYTTTNIVINLFIIIIIIFIIIKLPKITFNGR